VEAQNENVAIKFGTDGWRGVIAREFTFDNVARVGQATAGFLLSPNRKELAIYRDWGAEYRPAANGVVVGYDTRFLSCEFARHFARVLCDNGIPVAVSETPVPTPALSYAVVDRRAAAGIMFTASHNPPIYNGIKYKAEYGGSAPGEVTAAVEKRLPQGAPQPATPEGAIEQVDLKLPFLNKVRSLVDPERLTASPVQVVVDSMYGSAQGYVAELLSEHGVPFVQIRGTRDVLFGGKKPEPLEENLIPLRAVIASVRRQGKPLIGVVTDGDGDRISAMDETGRFIDAHRTFALILRYLVEERGWRGAVVKSFALTDMAKALCREYNLELIEVPIGFKYACEQILKRDVLIAAEESGSIAVRGHIPDSDGILTSVLLAEIVASSNQPVSKLVDKMLSDLGPHFCASREIKLDKPWDVIMHLAKNQPDRFVGQPVKKVEILGGVKLRLKDGWILFTAVENQPVLRLHAEMDRSDKVSNLILEAERFVRGNLRLL